MKKLRICANICGFAAMLTSFACYADKAKKLELSDFAYASEIVAESSAPVYKLRLSEQIYKNIVFTDARDIRIFNADNQSVAYEVIQPLHSNLQVVEKKTLPFFPIEQASDGASSAESIEIVQSDAGKIKKVTFSGASGKESNSTQYLVDLRAFHKQLSGLDLEWKSENSNALLPITVQASSDLRSWRDLAANYPLAQLQYGGETLVRKHISLTASGASYLKIFGPTNQSFEITSLTGQFSTVETQPVVRERTVIQGRAAGSYDGQFLFDTLGYLPARSLRLVLADNNSVLRYTLLSRANAEGVWQHRHSGVAYKISIDGHELTSAEEEITRTTDRYWLLRFSGKEVAINSAPTLELGWEPDSIIFLASGTAPFKLAYGSALAEKADFGIASFSEVRAGSTSLQPKEATLGSQVVLGGPQKLVPPAAQKPPAWRKFALWGILLLTVVVIGKMALGLSRELGQGGKQDE